MTYIGIDVGITGGLAALNHDGTIRDVREMPTRTGANGKPDYDIPAINHWLNHVCRANNETMDTLVAVERQQVMRGDGGVSGGSIMMGYGIIRGVVELYEVEGHFKYVSPITWQTLAYRCIVETCTACGCEMGGEIKPVKTLTDKKIIGSAGARHGRFCPKCLAKMNPKNRSVDACAVLFPGVDMRRTEKCKVQHLGMVDAALIAWWNFKTQLGTVKA
ncbi:MAG: hypothetical protein WC700_17145 [Gemmatimonadaceae bacterium]|jgi:hypothetical protein